MGKIPKDNYIYAYYQAINDGTVNVGKWIHAVYDIIVHGIESGVYVFDQKEANNTICWMENHSFHAEGALATQPLKFELWQKAMLSCIYGIKNPNDGKRQFREIFWLIGRKNGKTLTAASVAKHNWYLGGYGSKVFCTAPQVSQAELVYDAIWSMTQLDPEYQQLKAEIQASKDQHNKFTIDDSMLPKTTQKGLLIPGLNSLVRKVSYMTRDANGFNPSLTVADEIASWIGDKSKKHYEVFTSAIGAREMSDNPSLIFSCSTAGYTNDGIFDELFTRSTRFLKGDSKETKLLPFLYMIDDITKWDDINELRKANPNLGVSIPVDYLLEQINIARGSLSKKAEFLTKYCNIKQNSSQAFLEYTDVDKACGEPLQFADFEDCYCVLGIDLSQTTDLTASCAVIQRNGEFYIFCQFFLPEERIEDAIARDGLPYNEYIKQGLLTVSGTNVVDYHDVAQWCIDLVKKYRIYPMVTGYDRYSAQYLITELEQNKFKCDDVFQGHQLYPIIRDFEGLLKDGKIHIGNNSLLKVHMLNAALKMDTELNRGKLVKIKPTDHIDGLAAVIDAFTVRSKWWGQYGRRLENNESI